MTCKRRGPSVADRCGTALLAVSLAHEEHAPDIAAFLEKLREEVHARWCRSSGGRWTTAWRVTPRVRVVFGDVVTPAPPDPAAITAGTGRSDDPVPSAAKPDAERLQESDRRSRGWIRLNDDTAGADQH